MKSKLYKFVNTERHFFLQPMDMEPRYFDDVRAVNDNQFRPSLSAMNGRSKASEGAHYCLSVAPLLNLIIWCALKLTSKARRKRAYRCKQT